MQGQYLPADRHGVMLPNPELSMIRWRLADLDDIPAEPMQGQFQPADRDAALLRR